MINVFFYNILYYFGSLLISFIVGSYIVYLILNLTFFYHLIKISIVLYNSRCFHNFINKYGDYYLDLHMISGDEMKSVKVLTCNNGGQTIDILEYVNTSREKGAIIKSKLKNATLSPMYIDYNNWKKIENGIKLPYDMRYHISKFIADKKCDCEKIESSDDKKYFDIV